MLSCMIMISQVIISQVIISQVIISQVIISQVIISQVIISQVIISELGLRVVSIQLSYIRQDKILSRWYYRYHDKNSCIVLSADKIFRRSTRLSQQQ